jgi:hypothetical protein
MIATVFLGPSMSVDEARTILPHAIFRPPAAQGDLLAAVDQDGAEIIGLIDGTFHQTLSVWHSEICYLLSRGITLLGASSMGALRAAETERFGTVGVGAIFEWYRDGIIAGDDEVALVHGTEDDGYRQMSLVLVNIRASLSEAIRRGALAARYADQVIGVASALYYPDRRVETILLHCKDLLIPGEELSAIERVLTVDHVDLKRSDARKLLMLTNEIVEGLTPRPKRVEFEFNRSSVFETLYNLDRRVLVDDIEVTLQSIRECAALHDARFEQVQRAALDRSIVAVFAMLLGFRVTPEAVVLKRSEFLNERGINSDRGLCDWLRTNAMSDADLTEFLADEVLCARLRRWIMNSRGLDRSCGAVLDEARSRGMFPEWAEAAAEMEGILAAYQDQPEYRDMRLEDPRWLAAVHNANAPVQLCGDARARAEELGFDDVTDLIEALEHSAVYYDVKARIDHQLKALQRAEEMQGSVASEDRSS